MVVSLPDRLAEEAKALQQYQIKLRPLTANEGGGWLAEVPDLPGCTSDGNTPEEAAHNVQDAIEEWLAAARDMGRQIPEPEWVDESKSSG